MMTGFIKISFPLGLRMIDDYAFCECSQLKNIELPASVTYVGERTFSGCKLDTIKVHFTSPIELGSHAFYYDKPGDYYRPKVLSVPAGCKEVFEKAKGWNECKEIIEH